MSWEVEETTGLVDDIDVWLDGCKFGYDASYGDNPVFMLRGTSPDLPAENQEVGQFYSIGSGWEPVGNGKTVTHEDGKDDFHASCNYARFFRAALALSPEAEKTLQARGFPDDASIWDGLGFHLERQEIDYGSNIGKKRVLLPTAFLGEGEAPAKPSPNAAKAAAAKKAAANPMRARLVALAGEHTSHDDFLTAVYGEFPDIEEDSGLFGEVVVDTGGIWAEVHG